MTFLKTCMHISLNSSMWLDQIHLSPADKGKVTMLHCHKWESQLYDHAALSCQLFLLFILENKDKPVKYFLDSFWHLRGWFHCQTLPFHCSVAGALYLYRPLWTEINPYFKAIHRARTGQWRWDVNRVILKYKGNMVISSTKYIIAHQQQSRMCYYHITYPQLVYCVLFICYINYSFMFFLITSWCKF